MSGLDREVEIDMYSRGKEALRQFVGHIAYETYIADPTDTLAYTLKTNYGAEIMSLDDPYTKRFLIRERIGFGSLTRQPYQRFTIPGRTEVEERPHHVLIPFAMRDQIVLFAAVIEPLTPRIIRHPDLAIAR